MDNTEHDDGDGRIIYYYSREKRLKRASKTVRDFNNTPPPRKSGLFRTLTSTKPLAFLFVSVITVSLAVIILSRFLQVEMVRTLGNNTVIVSILASGDNSYVTIEKTIKSSGAYTGAVDIAVSVSAEETLIHVEQVYFGTEAEEVFRFIVPFRGNKMVVLMEAGSEHVLFTITPET